MRKLDRHVTLWTVLAPGDAGDPLWVVTLSGTRSSKARPTTADAASAFWTGVRSIDLFPSMADAMAMIERNGPASDWVRVGRDIRNAMNAWAHSPDETDDEEEWLAIPESGERSERKSF